MRDSQPALSSAGALGRASLEPPGPPDLPGAPATDTQSNAGLDVLPERPWVTLVWDDPVNLMSYVTWVLQKHFGYPRAKAESMMWVIHTEGRAVVSAGSREQMELDTEAMHGYGLWATFQKDD